MLNKINEFAFDPRTLKPPRMHQTIAMENKEVTLRGLQNLCMSCRLCKLGRKLITEKNKEFDPHVFSNMNAEAEFMVVGQNPGFNECQKGIPFVGAAGNNFDNELANHGLDRSSFYVTNIVKCHSINNTKPGLESVRICSKILELEIEAVKPTLIITLGAQAFGFFCPDNKYSDSLGTISKSEYGKIYAVYHPSPTNVNDPARRKSFNEHIRKLTKLIRHIQKEGRK
jgi:uracil-DNA glycosylase family 4